VGLSAGDSFETYHKNSRYDVVFKGAGNLQISSSNRYVTKVIILHVSCRIFQSNTNETSILSAKVSMVTQFVCQMSQVLRVTKLIKSGKM
jgi:hypothetical protein